ncbi:phage replisome organizer N-terminal domain-containing protein [Lactiplantibacillus sp. WILCCON 0030]|uniref:Phage replisome organizer N-terminal domain-containing protein n=1 Tax=Lactiplantibacillus brownii TaxID=3069269 RepID=A0ABU1A852_9LACO|nr:phage replisome organizer N-terminal domain-containing protein [Lactiplantibacillus brownii]MDQ7937077.1 phage replisome organizer N-terminal domain-containing protein [Lactiplantibacillus brownii]
MAGIHWIKLKTAMFDDEKIRLIEVMPEANAIIVIWIRLLVLAGKTNDSGLIYIQRDMSYSDEMLAALFNLPISTVRLAMTTLENFDMIDVSENGVISINNWDKHQNIEGMEKVRIQTAERVQRFRDKQRQQQIESNATCNVTVTEGNATESDSESDSETESDSKEHGPATAEHFDWQTVIDYLNEKTGKRFKHTDSNKRLVVARHKDGGYTVDDMKQVIDNQCAAWLTNPNMNQYLRPATLFRASKFEGYLNNEPKKSKPTTREDWFGETN